MSTKAPPEPQQLTDSQQALLVTLLEQMQAQGGDVPALKFRADNYVSVDQLNRFEEDGLIRRENDCYVLQVAAIPLLSGETPVRLLDHIERIYAVLRERYQKAQQAPVTVSALGAEAKLAPTELRMALRLMLTNFIWCAGRSGDLLSEEAFVMPAEAVLRNLTFVALIEEVRGWNSRRPVPHPHPPMPVAPSEEPRQVGSLLRAWPAVRTCLQEFSFYDIKEVAGLAGFDVTATAHLVQKAQGGASKGRLMSAVDQQVGAMDAATRARFLTTLIEEILRRRPGALEKLSEYLSRLGWSFVRQTLVPLDVLDTEALSNTPSEAHKDLLKAAQRLRDGDLGGTISAACGAVDTATSKVYEQFGLGDPTDASFQERCKRAAQARGVLVELDKQLSAMGWSAADVVPFKKNLEGALNQGAYVMQTLRSRMGDVHGSKPILRSLVFDCLRWAELIVGSLVERPI